MGLRRRKDKLKELVLNNKEQINIKLLAILTVVAVSLDLFSSKIMSMIMSLSSTPVSKLENMVKLMQGGLGLLIGALIAPVIEEIVFRGIIVDGIITRYSQKTAIVVSAVLFSIYHFNIFQLLSSFVVGLLLGYIYLETRSVVVCIVTHFIYDLIPLVMNQTQPFRSGVPKIEKMDYIIVVVSRLVLVSGIKLLHNYFQYNSVAFIGGSNGQKENY
ncbi:CPBP family intramembrane glutamic endopeptidase [Halobacteroides halobius]|nr:CPBP family intramembrane glutamic endopeptidase [Halobacteroides halobius]